MPHYVAPGHLADSFTCPFCDNTSPQKWYLPDHMIGADYYDSSIGEYIPVSHQSLFDAFKGRKYKAWAFAQCAHCKGLTVWKAGKMIDPEPAVGVLPNDEMPEKVLEIYREASSVFPKSPRASAALLRLALQILLETVLGDDAKKRIVDNIGILQDKKSCSVQLIKAMDIIRHEGNESVHPGEINLNDNEDEARYLFVLLNMICEEFFSAPKRLEESYSLIPEGKRVGIDE